MKKIFVVLFSVLALSAYSQKYFTKSGIVKFHSDSPMEKIEGVNSTASSVIDMASGKMEFAVLINAFKFEKALMQEHFNENYMESTKFPKAVFKGEIQNFSSVSFDKVGKFTITVSGEMTIHGVKKNITAPVDIVVDAKGVHSNTKFNVLCSDYNIKIPSLVKDNISNEINLTIKADYQKLN